MVPELDELENLPGPFEILEMMDKEEITLRPLDFALGKAMIEPRDGQPPKMIRILRIHVSPDFKPTLPQYWDLTAQHLVAGLYPYFSRPGWKGRVFTIKKIGQAPRARFTLKVGSATE